MPYFPPITLLLTLQWHIEVCKETFTANSKIAQTTQSIGNFIVRKSILQEMANFGNYSGDFRHGETVQNLECPGLSGRVDGPTLTKT